MRFHEPDYDENLGLIIVNERNAHELVVASSKRIIKMHPEELKTSRYGEFDVICDFSDLDEQDFKTTMRNGNKR